MRAQIHRLALLSLIEMELKELLVRKENLLKNIESVKQKKKEIIEIVQTLVKEFNKGRIDKKEYEEKLKKALGGKSAEQWVKYYDDYLAYYNYQLKLCEKLIKENKQKDKSLVRIKVLKVLIGLVFVGIIVSLLFNFSSVFVDYIGEKGVDVLEFGKKVDDKGIEEIGEMPTLQPSSEISDEEAGEELKKFEPEIIGGVGETIQYSAIVGEKVRFKTKVKGDFDKIILPAGVEIKSVKSVEKGVKREVEFREDRKNRLLFFGERSVEVEITSKPTLTGEVVGNDKGILDYEIIYEIPGPVVELQESKEKKVEKRVVVRGRDDLHFQNVLAFSDIKERVGLNEINRIKIYRIDIVDSVEVKSEVKFSAYDSNENGLIDRVEWIVPYLSEVVYEIIIEVKEAEHLDSDRNFISDIYEEVKALDGVWSEKIYHNEYVRVVFIEKLNNSNDITIYARGDGNNIIEVYETGSDVKIAEFSVIGEENYYRVYLSELKGVQDSFDLKIKSLDGNESAYAEIDYIVDPTIYVYNCNDLQTIGLADNVLLMNDIDCSMTNPGDANFNPSGPWADGAGFNPIGLPANSFTGTFDGKGYVIDGLYINRASENYVGLFRIIGGTVKNVGLKNVYIKGGYYTGSLAGVNNGAIENIYSTGVVEGGGYVGGLVSNNGASGNIQKSFSKANVNGFSYVGGFVGYNIGTVKNSYSTGDLTTPTGSLARSGGFVGYNLGTVENSYSTGQITANSRFNIGGFAGQNDNIIRNSFTTYPIFAGAGAGINSYSNTDKTVFYGSSHVVYHGSTVSSPPDWDFNSIWLERFNNLPVLRWEMKAISTCEELQGIGATTKTLSDNYILTKDIDCSGTINWNFGNGFEPIGDISNPFTGVFDGNGFTISNLYINRNSELRVGLFAYIGPGAMVSNLKLKNIDITGADFVGGLVGLFNQGIIKNVEISGEVTASNTVGGLVGSNYLGNITRVYANVNVNILGSFWNAGGLVGQNSGKITESYAVGNVNGGANVGGLAGINTNAGEINNSYATGNVAGQNEIGGLVGYNFGFIRNVYARGSVSGFYNIGGLVGHNNNAIIANSYAVQGGKLIGLEEGTSTILNSFYDAESVFYGSSHVVYHGSTVGLPPWAPDWNFADIWLERSNNLPVLRWREIEINSCMILNIPNSVYKIIGNIEDNSLTNDCIRILAENITLDCQGFSIKSINNYAGIYSNKDNSVIKNCRVSMGATNGYGIKIESANNTLILNNILTYQKFGLLINRANYSYIKNNTLNNNSHTGGYVLSSYNNVLINNSAVNNSFYGFYLVSSLNNTLINITANNNTAAGIYLNRANFTKLENIIANNNSNNGGVLIRDSFNNTLNNTFANYNKYGIFIYAGSSGNLIKDSNFSFNNIQDVRVMGNSLENTCLNCSYSESASKEYVQLGSVWVRKWYYRAYVEDENLNPIDGAVVVATNRSDDIQFELATDASGYTPMRSIIDYVNLGGEIVDYDNHFLYAYKGILHEPGTLYDSHSYTADKNNYEDKFTLKSPLPPEIVYITDVNGYLNSVDVPSDDRDLLADNSVAKRFEFYVWSEDLNSLPVSGITDSDALLILRDKNLPNDERKSSDGGNAETCIYLRDDVAPAGSVGYAGENVKVYSCKVAMWYYDDYGVESSKNWEVKAMIKDNFGNEDSNNIVNSLVQPLRETYFNRLEGFKIIPEPVSLNFGPVDYKPDLNKEPLTNHPLNIVNTGNADIDVVGVMGNKIPGSTNNNEYIPPEWFSIDPVNSCNGVVLIDSVYVNSGLPDIIHGEGKFDELRICLKMIQTSHSGGSVSQQAYSTTNILQGGSAAKPWLIEVTSWLLVAVSIRRKRKKNEKLKELISEDLFEAFEEKLIRKYGIDIEGLLSIADEKKIKKKGVKIPVDIFKEGGAEVLTKYLRENAGLRFSEIAELINRDPRTISVNYKNALDKKRKVEFGKDSLLVPVEAFADRKLSIMEIVVSYLREKGFRNYEIAEMLNKDERVIGTLLSRARRKTEQLTNRKIGFC